MKFNETFTILIIDDEKFYTDILDYILSPMYDVHVANSGKYGIEMARTLKPDLILLDVIMPDVLGFDVFAELTEDKVTQNIPVIFITGLNNVEDEEKGLFLGAVDYITKPFNDSIVKARIRTHLQIVKHIRTIEQLCLIDALTGITNRRGFDNRMSSEWAHAVREEMPISIMMIDLDKYKMFNDTYGHMMGDVLLQNIARVLEHSIKRATDLASRWGGDEFAVLLSGTDSTGAIEVADRIRKNVADMQEASNIEEDLCVTLSIGINSINPTLNDSIEDFFNKADIALYAAKDGGRNRVCLYSDIQAKDNKELDSESEEGANELKSDNQDDLSLYKPYDDEAVEIQEQKNQKEENKKEENQAVPKQKRMDIDLKRKNKKTSLTSLLKSISDLDVDRAINSIGGSEEAYEKMMTLTLKILPENIEEMDKYLTENADLRAFSIKTHNMKGLLNQIGHRQLGELAGKLEHASRDGNMEYCKNNYNSFRDQLCNFYDQIASLALKNASEQEKNKVAENVHDYIDELMQIKSELDNFNSVAALELLSSLTTHNFDTNVNELISSIVNALELFDIDGAQEYMDKLETFIDQSI